MACDRIRTESEVLLIELVLSSELRAWPSYESQSRRYIQRITYLREDISHLRRGPGYTWTIEFKIPDNEEQRVRAGKDKEP